MDITDLRRGFEYDLWANCLWLDAAPEMPKPKQAMDIMGHIVWAQENWAGRIDPDYAPHETASLQERFRKANAHWRVILRDHDLKRVVSYRNSSGQPYNRQVGAIAWHVINHGTYHRGQLRGLATASDYFDFPETDLNGFFIETDLYGATA